MSSLRKRLDKLESDATDTTPDMHVVYLYEKGADVDGVPEHIHTFTDRDALDTWADALPEQDVTVLIDMRTTPAPEVSTPRAHA